MCDSSKCQCCGETSGVENIVVFGTGFTVCAYCRNEARDVLNGTYLWSRDGLIRKKLHDIFYPDHLWGGWKKYFTPSIPSRLDSRGFESIRKALGDEKDVQDAIEFFSSTHIKYVSQSGHAGPDVECKPTDIAKQVVSLLSSLKR